MKSVCNTDTFFDHCSKNPSQPHILSESNNILRETRREVAAFRALEETTKLIETNNSINSMLNMNKGNSTYFLLNKLM